MKHHRKFCVYINRRSITLRRLDHTKRWIVLFWVMACTALAGCSSEGSETDGGFVRETYTGVVEEQILDENKEYLRVDIGNDEVIDFMMTTSSEIDEDAAISVGDTVEIDCVLWYDTNTYEILKLTMIG